MEERIVEIVLNPKYYFDKDVFNNFSYKVRWMTEEEMCSDKIFEIVTDESRAISKRPKDDKI